MSVKTIIRLNLVTSFTYSFEVYEDLYEIMSTRYRMIVSGQKSTQTISYKIICNSEYIYTINMKYANKSRQQKTLI